MVKVSIIIPSYNRSHLIMATIQSAIAQTYKNIEIIVVDDGSTDDTEQVLKPFADEGKIIYHYQQNAGRSNARNQGAKLSTGDYLLFLDSDDLLVDTAIENLAALKSKYPESKIFGGKVGLFFENREEVSYESFNYPSSMYNFQVNSFNYFISIGAFIIERELFFIIQGFNEKYRVAEDVDFSIKALYDNLLTWSSNIEIVHKKRHPGNTKDDIISQTSNQICNSYIEKLKQNKLPKYSSVKNKFISELYQQKFTNHIILKNKTQGLFCYCQMIRHSPLYLFSLNQWKHLAYLLLKT